MLTDSADHVLRVLDHAVRDVRRRPLGDVPAAVGDDVAEADGENGNQSGEERDKAERDSLVLPDLLRLRLLLLLEHLGSLEAHVLVLKLDLLLH